MKVLIVDDSTFMRAVIAGYLKAKYPYIKVYEASDPESAYQKFLKHRPDFTTMDITMSSSGLNAIRMIKSTDTSAKIIIVSAMGQKVYIEEGIKLGATDFVVKPFNPQRLYEAVDKLKISPAS